MTKSKSKSNRDDFTETTKRVMAERVAWRCCFPDCGKITIGPRMGEGENNKSLNLGEAAHIIAAAPEGPRFDPRTTPEYRKSIDNGIWMCRAHARMIDSDYKEFSVETLRLWKSEAEQKAYKELGLQENYKFNSNTTLVALGYGIIFEAKWKSVQNDCWTFIVDNFIAGDFSKLKAYSDSFVDIESNQRFISVESQGDSRIINQPIKIDYLDGIKTQITIYITSKNIASLPKDAGIDFMIGEDGDIVFDGNDIKMVTGLDKAIQSISTAAGIQYGEWFADKTAGSFISDYYHKYSENKDLLNKLFKLEIVRLSLVPRINDGKLIKPPLDFIKEVKNVVFKSYNKDESKALIFLRLILGDGEEWSGDIKVFIKI